MAERMLTITCSKYTGLLQMDIRLDGNSCAKMKSMETKAMSVFLYMAWGNL